MGVCLLPSRNDKCKCIFRIEYMVRVSRFSLLLAVFSFLTAFTALYAQGGADDVKHKFAPINTAIPSLRPMLAEVLWVITVWLLRRM